MHGVNLSGNKLLNSLPASTKQEIIELCPLKFYSKGEHLIRQLDTSVDLCIINTGSVRITSLSDKGTQVSFIDMSAGSVFGELSAIDGLPRSANVVTLEDSHIRIIPKEIFDDLLESHPLFCTILLKELCLMIRRLNSRILEYTSMDVPARIRAEIVRITMRQGELLADGSIWVKTPPTHEEIAARVSTHREAVTRCSNELKKEGLISKKGRSLIINSLEKLQDSY